ncbi:hypothetical protein UT4_04890 [Ferrigenium sp. UT4]
MLFFAFGVFELAEVHDATDRRFRHGRNLDQIQFRFIRHAQRFRYGHDANLLSLRANEPHLWCRYLLVQSLRLILCYCNFSIKKLNRASRMQLGIEAL